MTYGPSSWASNCSFHYSDRPTACNRPRDTIADFVELALSTPAAWAAELLAAISSAIESLCLGEVGTQTNTQASNMRLHQ